MKTLKFSIIIALFLCLSSFNSNEKKTYFYYCTSRTIESAIPSPTKFQFKYTNIKSAELDEAEMKNIVQKWASYINQNCENVSTSDVYFYNPLEKAERLREDQISKKKESGKYELIEVKFE